MVQFWLQHICAMKPLIIGVVTKYTLTSLHVTPEKIQGQELDEIWCLTN